MQSMSFIVILHDRTGRLEIRVSVACNLHLLHDRTGRLEMFIIEP